MNLPRSRNLIPGQGAILSAPHKKYEELIVFVHHFGGSKLTMRRHVHFVNELGFDALTFNLSFNEGFWLQRIPLSRTKRIGLRHIWGDEVEDVLNAVPGPKIVFAFSNPAATAIDAIARRKAKDIKGLITDSGPFAQMLRCSWNLLSQQYVVKNRVLRVYATGFLNLLWGVDHTQRLHKDIASLPKNFPVLSIRGWNDRLVPVSTIDDAYSGVEHLKYETLALPKGEHLNGLKDFPEDYKPKVARFLDHIATKL